MERLRRRTPLLALLALAGVPAATVAQDELPVYRVLAVEGPDAQCTASLVLEHERSSARATVCITDRTEIAWQGDALDQPGEAAAISDIVVGAQVTALLVSVSEDGDPTPVVTHARWIRIRKDVPRFLSSW